MSDGCKQYEVVGGQLISVDQPYFIDFTASETHGPFDTYQAAYDVWKARSFSTIDNAHTRFFIRVI